MKLRQVLRKLGRWICRYIGRFLESLLDTWVEKRLQALRAKNENYVCSLMAHAPLDVWGEGASSGLILFLGLANEDDVRRCCTKMLVSKAVVDAIRTRVFHNCCDQESWVSHLFH